MIGAANEPRSMSAVRRQALVAILLALLVGVPTSCGGGDEQSSKKAPPKRTALFGYDRSAPLQYRDRGVINRGYPVAVHDVSYASPRGGRVPGYLAVPPGKGPYPAVIYMHGAGQDRLAFIAQATWLAGRRAITLTITSPFTRPPIPQIPRGVAGIRKDRDLNVQGVVDLRRAVDLLQSLPKVDDERIGYAGLSAGARTGAILAGVEDRIKAYVLMSGGATPAREYAGRVPKQLRAQVLRLVSETDPLRYVRDSSPARVLFKDGLNDELVPRAALVRLYRAAGKPKELRWYGTGHTLNVKAFRDQLAWLSDALPIDGPSVKGALTGPPAP